MGKFGEIMAVIEAAKVDAEKFYVRGNKAAGKRIRKALMDIKTLAHDGRKEITAAE